MIDANCEKLGQKNKGIALMWCLKCHRYIENLTVICGRQESKVSLYKDDTIYVIYEVMSTLIFIDKSLQKTEIQKTFGKMFF